MEYRSLNDFVKHLESRGELIRIGTLVSPDLEVTEITDRIVKRGGPAMLFENNGTSFPLLINAFGSDSRMAAALRVDEIEEIPAGLNRLMEELMQVKDAGMLGKLAILPKAHRMSRWLPRKVKGRGECQQVVMDKPNLSALPVLRCWPHDGGPFITLPLVHTVDPVSGQSNTGMYRMHVYDEVTTGMHWHLHKDGAAHFRKYRELGKRMPVTVTLGGDPAMTYAATAPLPPFLDETLFTGVIRKRGVLLVKSLTNDIWIPADSDIVIEGYVDPEEPFRTEGPFGDHTGFYSLADLYPVFHVTAITHRRDAVYPATIVGIPPQEDLWLGKATEKIFLMPIRKAIAPEVVDMHMPPEGVFHNLVITSIEKSYPGQPQKVASALWGAGQMMLNKIVALLNSEYNLNDYQTVIRTISRNVDPAKDIFFNTGPLDVLDHSSSTFAFGSKMGIDATNERDLPIPEGLRAESSERLKEIRGVDRFSDAAVARGAALLMLFVDKSAGNTVRQIHDEVVPALEGSMFRFIFYLDSEASGLTLSDCVWLVSGNIDPQRDYLTGTHKDGSVIAGFDATRKTAAHDGFPREWPNLTAMDEATISLVDERWDSYGLGEFTESPSGRFLKYLRGNGAVAEE